MNVSLGKWIRLPFAFVAWFAVLVSSLVAQAEYTIDTKPGSGIDIKIISIFDQTPARGAAPMRVKISNNTQNNHSWDVRWFIENNHGYEQKLLYSQRFEVPAGKQAVFEIAVPILNLRHRGWGGLNLQAQVFGHAIRDSSQRYIGGHSGNRDEKTPYILMSTKPGEAWWSKLENAGNSRNKRSRGSGPRLDDVDLFGSQLPVESFPTKWSGWQGVDLLMITDEEWKLASQEMRATILDWVKNGGILWLYYTPVPTRLEREVERTVPASPTADGSAPAAPQLVKEREWYFEDRMPVLPDLSTDLKALGWGKVEYRVWNPNGENIEKLIDELADITPFYDSMNNDEYRPSNFLADKLPEVSLNPPLIIGFVILFSLLVGPVNLFVFAKPGKRWRLFWTTPALSLAASFVLIILILLMDGMGGQGTRLAFWHHLPDSNQIHIIQEQMTRTGVLWKRDFTLKQDTFIQPLFLNTPKSGRNNESAQLNLTATGHADGDWFRSRSLMAHMVQTRETTRSEMILRKEGKSLVAESSWPQLIRKLYVRDENGKVWFGKEIAPGTPTKLESVKESEMNEWLMSYASLELNTTRPPSDMVIPSMLNAAGGNRNVFWAEMSPRKEDFLATLQDVRWVRESIILYGTAKIEGKNP